MAAQLQCETCEDTQSPGYMRQRDGEVEIKIILLPDPSDDNGVLLYCYHGNRAQEGSGIVAELSTGPAEPLQNKWLQPVEDPVCVSLWYIRTLHDRRTTSGYSPITGSSLLA